MKGMFEYVKLKNFKSYSDVKFDITNKMCYTSLIIKKETKKEGK